MRQTVSSASLNSERIKSAALAVCQTAAKIGNAIVKNDRLMMLLVIIAVGFILTPDAFAYTPGGSGTSGGSGGGFDKDFGASSVWDFVIAFFAGLPGLIICIFLVILGIVVMVSGKFLYGGFVFVAGLLIYSAPNIAISIWGLIV